MIYQFYQKQTINITEFDESLIQFKTCHSGGKCGQNVNKVETGVHAIYTPSGDSTFCTEERSQYSNKKKAIERLRSVIENRNINNSISKANDMRKSHIQLERGNAVMVFEGENFKKKGDK